MPIYRRSDHGAFAHLLPKQPWGFCPSIAEATMGLLWLLLLLKNWKNWIHFSKIEKKASLVRKSLLPPTPKKVNPKKGKAMHSVVEHLCCSTENTRWVIKNRLLIFGMKCHLLLIFCIMPNSVNFRILKQIFLNGRRNITVIFSLKLGIWFD